MDSYNLAATDRWMLKNNFQNNLTTLNTLYLNQIPYSILQRISIALKQRWEQWEPITYNWAGRTIMTAKEFVLCVSDGNSKMSVSQLIEISQKIDSLAITKCFTECKSYVQERQKADSDSTKGFMDDLNEETVILLAQRIGQSSIDWRLLADGLGFDNLTCQKFDTPKIMIEQLVKLYPNSSVSRLYFEASNLKMDSVCHFLDAIPIEGISKKLANLTCDAPITRYELERFNECVKECKLKINWQQVATDLCFFNSEKCKFTAIELIWTSRRVSITELFRHLNLKAFVKPAITKFKSEIESGTFENKSPGGISYAQIRHLALASGVDSATDYIFSYYMSNIRIGINVQILRAHIFPDLRVDNFESFMSLYWQDPKFGEKLSLKEFCHKMIYLLENVELRDFKACNNPKVIEAFRSGYNEIKPLRSYNPLLDQ